MTPLEAVLLDGANGVGQHARVGTLSVGVVLAGLGALAGAAWLLRRRRSAVVAALLLVTFVPGWLALARRPDGPVGRARLVLDVEAVRAAFLAAARGALPASPGGCFVIPDQADCLPYLALFRGATVALEGWRLCDAGEAAIVLRTTSCRFVDGRFRVDAVASAARTP
jgi:hypothetical protein